MVLLGAVAALVNFGTCRGTEDFVSVFCNRPAADEGRQRLGVLLRRRCCLSFRHFLPFTHSDVSFWSKSTSEFHAKVVCADHSLTEPPLGRLFRRSDGLLPFDGKVARTSDFVFDAASRKAPSLFGRAAIFCFTGPPDETVRAEAAEASVVLIDATDAAPLPLPIDGAVLAPERLRKD